MRGRLLLAFAAVIALGALLDATVHRDSVGQPTVGPVRAEAVAGTDQPRDRSVPTFVGTSALLDWYTLPLAVREYAPGTEVILDAQVPRGAVPELYLRAMGAARSVRTADLSGVSLPDRRPDVAGEAFWYGPWTLEYAGGPIETLLVFSGDGPFRLIDARLVLGAPLTTGTVVDASEVTLARAADDPPRIRWSVVAETAVLLVFLLVGGLILPRGAALEPSLRVLVALPVGIALHATVGMLRLPGIWGLVATLGTAGALSLAVLRRRGVPVGWRTDDLGRLGAVAVGIASIVGWVRWSAFLALTPDSRDYWSGGALFADGTLGLHLLDVKRGLSQQSMHAVGFALGIEGLQGLGAVLMGLIAGILLQVAIVRAGRDLRLLVPVGLVIAAFLLSPQVRTMAAYLNSHMLVAALLLVLAILVGAAADTNDRRHLTVAVLVLVPALVTSRAEGALLVALALIGAFAGDARPARWRVAWFGLAAATGAWTLMLRIGEVQLGGWSLGLIVLAVIALGALTVGVLLSTPVARLAPMLPGMSWGVLWGVALILMLGLESVRFLDASVANIAQGSGGWGLFGILLVVAGALVVILGDRHDATNGAARGLLIGFIPITLLVKLGDGLQAADAELSLLLSGGGRSGWGDSVNRMWMHLVPVLLYLLIRLFVQQAPGSDPASPRWQHTGSLTGVLARRAAGARHVAVLGVAAWSVAQWAPVYLPTTSIDEQTILRVETDQPMDQLTSGITVQQSLDLREVRPPAGTSPVRLCVAVPFVTFFRENVGTVDIEVRSDRSVATRTREARELGDWVGQRLCLDLDREGPLAHTLPTDVVVTLRGLGGVQGQSAALLEGTGGSEGAGQGAGAVATAADGTPAFGGRPLGPLGLEASVVVVVPPSPFVRALDHLARVVPAVALILGGALVGHSLTKRRRARRQRSHSVPAP